MGDRANVYLIDRTVESADPGGLYLYTHWNGDGWPERLRMSLKFGRERWDDPPYLTRILISQLYADVADSTTGGGISHQWCDNDGYPLLVVDIPHQQVAFAPNPSTGTQPTRDTWYGKKSFEEFVVKPAQWPEA